MATILTYHHVDDPPPGEKDQHLYVTPSAFESQMNFLKKEKFNVVSLDELRAEVLGETRLSPRSVAITFDDGFEDNYLRAFPILKRHDFPAAFFITTDRIGSVDERGRRHMNAGQLRDLTSSGMTAGSHTVNHPWLARIPPSEAEGELAESKRRLEGILDGPVQWLCYPHGSFNREIATMAEELGYSGACSVIRDNRPKSDQLFFLPRVMVMRDTSAMRFRYYFSSLYHHLHARKNRRRWKQYV